jgi:hypothetical protein
MQKLLPTIIIVLSGCFGGGGGGLPEAGDSVAYLELCSIVGQAKCDRTQQCGVEEDVETCEADWMASCCGNADVCAEERILREDLEPCVDEYSGYSCLLIVDDMVPRQCLEI